MVRYLLDAICESGRLQGVDVFNLKEAPGHRSATLSAVRLRFEQRSATLLKIGDDEDLWTEDECNLSVAPDQWTDVSQHPVWSECIGCEVVRAWCMTSQKGYTDAMRIEFKMLDNRGSRIVECVVVGSAFRFFVAREM